MDSIYEALRQSIEIRQQHGANSPTPLEWWYLTGHLWKADSNTSCNTLKDVLKLRGQPNYAVQSTFFLSDAMQPRGLLSHASESRLDENTHHSSERVAVFTDNSKRHPLAFVSQGLLNIALGNWNFLHLGHSPQKVDWGLNFDVRESTYQLQLTFDKSSLWFHGNNGILKKTDTSENFYYTIPFVVASGQRIYRSPDNRTEFQTVCGRLWFDHEIHVKNVNNVGWRWFGLTFNNARALMIYQIFENGKFRPAGGEMWQEESKKSTLLENVSIDPQESKCLDSGRCYPQKFNIEFTLPGSKEKQSVRTESWFPEQEVSGGTGGLGRPYWEGGVKALWSSSGQKESFRQPVEGLGYTELVLKDFMEKRR
jgi:predicted secreted hydrolase